ncbi:putative response regulatory protein [Vallitalea longa]|uniref:Stage 0 sporulation protein A homolog n=1 Tax=Vallitalea longa TaxID=2936439 RepID=A0A9W5Y7R4_9FIRM|nr:response regulator [Vallitalea longa]GKX28555.1 putative response regulatory protein [Vallitalea longa]
MVKVVVVEDEILTRKGLVITTPWEELGCKVVGEASNGSEGIEMILRVKPHIVITDVRMPKMDGINMIKDLKNKIKAEYIIISGYDEFKYAQQAISLGVKEYLLKPVEDNELYDALEKIVNSVESKKEEYEKEYNAIDEFFDFQEYQNNITEGKKRYVSKAIKCIRNDYFNDINIKEVADKLYITESYLSRLFKKETGYTFVDYLTRYRCKMAISLLQDEHIRIYQVAELVGFNDSRYFSSIFKKYVGITPTKLKEQL